jgi:hypothetical protein
MAMAVTESPPPFVVADVSKAICEGSSQLGGLVLKAATVTGPLGVVILSDRACTRVLVDHKLVFSITVGIW